MNCGFSILRLFAKDQEALDAAIAGAKTVANEDPDFAASGYSNCVDRCLWNDLPPRQGKTWEGSEWQSNGQTLAVAEFRMLERFDVQDHIENSIRSAAANAGVLVGEFSADPEFMHHKNHFFDTAFECVGFNFENDVLFQALFDYLSPPSKAHQELFRRLDEAREAEFKDV